MSQVLHAPGKMWVGKPPIPQADTIGRLWIGQEAADGNDNEGSQYSADDGNAPKSYFRKSRGTLNAPAIVATADRIGEFSFSAYTNQWHECTKILSTVRGAPAAGVIPDSDLQFVVANAGGRNLRVRIMPNGQTIMGQAVNESDAVIASEGKGRLWIAGADSHDALAIQRSSADSGGSSIYGRKSRGSLAAPATVATNDEMIYVQGSAYTNQWHDNVGAIAMYIDGAVTAGQRPGNRIVLRTGQSGAGGPSDRLTIDKDGNIGIRTTSFGTNSQGVLGVANAAVVPAGNPAGGGVLYAEAGAGKWRGSGGTITTFGPADPHCPDCGLDFGWEFERPAEIEPDPARRYLAVCLHCLMETLDQLRPGPKGWARRLKPVGPAVEPPALPVEPERQP